MRVVSVIQARMGSSRLPGKVMFPLGDKTILQHVVDKARKISDEEVYIVTDYDSISQLSVQGATILPAYGLVSNRFRKLFYELYERDISYNDVLFVRLCGDQPFVDDNLVSPLADILYKTGADYAGYMVGGRPSALTAYGIYPEVFRGSLMTVTDPSDHVTLPIYMRPDLYKCAWIDHEPYVDYINKRDYLQFSLTIDSILDYYRLVYWYNEGKYFNPGGDPFKNDERYDWL